MAQQSEAQQQLSAKSIRYNDKKGRFAHSSVKIAWEISVHSVFNNVNRLKIILVYILLTSYLFRIFMVCSTYTLLRSIPLIQPAVIRERSLLILGNRAEDNFAQLENFIAHLENRNSFRTPPSFSKMV